jgi:hypothetical protein
MLSPSLQQERARLLEEMAHIDRMVRGHVSQQTYQVQRGERTVTQGPYHLWLPRENGRNNCQRVGADESGMHGRLPLQSPNVPIQIDRSRLIEGEVYEVAQWASVADVRAVGAHEGESESLGAGVH